MDLPSFVLPSFHRFRVFIAGILTAIGVRQTLIGKLGLPRRKDWFEKGYGLPREEMGALPGEDTNFITDEEYLKYLCGVEPAESQIEWFKKSAQFCDYAGPIKMADAGVCPGIKSIRIVTAEEFMQISILSGYKLVEVGNLIPLGRFENYECWYNSEKDDAVVRHMRM